MSGALRNVFEQFREFLKNKIPGAWNPIFQREAHAIFTFLVTLPFALLYFLKMISGGSFLEYHFFGRFFQYIHMFIYFFLVALARVGVGMFMRSEMLPANSVLDYDGSPTPTSSSSKPSSPSPKPDESTKAPASSPSPDMSSKKAD